MNCFPVKFEVDPYQYWLVRRPFVLLVPFIILHTSREIYLSPVTQIHPVSGWVCVYAGDG